MRCSEMSFTIGSSAMDLNNFEKYSTLQDALRRLEELRASGHLFEMWAEHDNGYAQLEGANADTCYIIVWG